MDGGRWRGWWWRRLRAEQALATRRIEPRQQSRAGATLTGDDAVLQRRRGRGEGADAQRPGMHPNSGDELEILGDTPVEQEAARGIVRIREPYCIADSVEPVRVERRRRELGALPVPRRDMGAAHPDFELAGARHQLELDARDRDAHYAGTIDRKMRGSRQRRGFGRAPGRGHGDAPTGRTQRNRFQPVPKILRQRGGRIEDEP